jgi:hypothetical protein
MLQPNNPATRVRVRALHFALHFSAPRALFALVLLSALALCAFALTNGARAQSRRAPRPATTPTPEATPEATPQGESESQPRGSASKKDASIIASFNVLEDDDIMMSFNYTARDDIWKVFIDRLSKSRAVSVSQGGTATRGQARERAKSERDTYTVVFQIEEQRELSGDPSMGNADARAVVLKTFVYEPKTANLKFADTIYQRPYRESTTIGGVRVPLPTGTRRIERYPSQRQLEQAARDAADRILSRFNVLLPPDN